MTGCQLFLLLTALFTEQCQCAVDVEYSHKVESDTGHGRFGESLATSHRKLVIGAPDDFNYKGSITVDQGVKITPPAGSTFGMYTDVNQEFIAVSNFGPNSVMVFDASAPYALKASIPVPCNIKAVDIAEGSNTITISIISPYSSCQVRVYEYDGSSSWHLSQEIDLGECYGAPFTRMPLSVSVSHLAVGVHDGESGHVVIYEKQGKKWVMQQTVDPPLSASKLGVSIAMRAGGNLLTVHGGGTQPDVFIYRRDSITKKWLNTGKLVPPRSSSGRPVLAIHQDILLVTVTAHRELPEVCGVAYKVSHNATVSTEPFATLKTSDTPLGEFDEHMSVSVQEGLVFTGRVRWNYATGAVFVHDLSQVRSRN